MNDLELTRILPVPRATVWKCWTDPDLLIRWFTPRPHQTLSAKIDLRPGGEFSTVMLVDGTQYPNTGVFLEVEPETKLVVTDNYAPGWVPNPTPFMTAIVTFSDHPEGTRYNALVRHRTPEDTQRHVDMGFHTGWGAAADQLAELAALIG